jgi:hypothetical protein
MSKKMFNLCFLSKNNEPPATIIDGANWGFVEDALDDVYEYGGFLYLKIENDECSYVKELHLISKGKCFRIVAITRDADKKRELLEWWNPLLEEYLGESLFSDDAYDSRMVSNDLEIGKKIFRDFFEDSELMPINLANFRSQWNPLPR